MPATAVAPEISPLPNPETAVDGKGGHASHARINDIVDVQLHGSPKPGLSHLEANKQLDAAELPEASSSLPNPAQAAKRGGDDRVKIGGGATLLKEANETTGEMSDNEKSNAHSPDVEATSTARQKHSEKSGEHLEDGDTSDDADPNAGESSGESGSNSHDDSRQANVADSPGQLRTPSLAPGSQADTDFSEEARDVATPIASNLATSYFATPTGSVVNNGNLPPTPRISQDWSVPTPKGTPPTGSPARKSISSTFQSSRISWNRERVRYSWQSVQEEEPNRPRIHIVKLVSNTVTASAGFPGGEALQYSFSPGGSRMAAYNSARLYILQTAALPVGVSQDYALKRRPLAVEVVDEGNMLAILADEHTVNIYDLGQQEVQRVRTLKLDFPTTCIALAPTGGLFAAAYEGGIEIFSLAPSALPTDRRAVRSARMDQLVFSEDSSTLLGTTTRINASSTVVVSVPVFPADPSGLPTHEELKEAWCSGLLHPENIRNSSHASFLREKRKMCNDRLFSWNGLADTFGILNVSDLQYSNVDFPVVISPPLSTCGGLGAAIHSCPAIDEHGETVAMVVNDRTIRLYIVPPKTSDYETTVEAHSIDHELDEGYGNPFSEVKWVQDSTSPPAPGNGIHNQGRVQGRLIVASPGGVLEPTAHRGFGMAEEDIEDIEGGRIIIFDFDPQFVGQLGQTYSLTLGKPTPQLLEEEEVDVAEEVALVRKRTVNQKKGGGLIHRPVQLGRAASTLAGKDRRARGSLSNYNDQNEATRSLPDLVEDAEALDAFEAPYQPNAPRSQASLQRAASNVQRHRFQTLEEKNAERMSRDVDSHVIPLPEYTEEPNAPLPSRYRALAGLDQPTPGPTNGHGVTGGHANEEDLDYSNFSQDHDLDTMEWSPASYARFHSSRRPSHPPSSRGTDTSTRPNKLESLAGLPQSLQRVYSNTPIGRVLTPSRNGEWGNMTPMAGYPSSSSRPHGNAASEDEMYDTISPLRASQSLSTLGGQSPNVLYGRPNETLGSPVATSPAHSTRSASMALYNAAVRSYSVSAAPATSLEPNLNPVTDRATSSGSIFAGLRSSGHNSHRQPPRSAGSAGHWRPPSSSNGPPGLSAGSTAGGMSRARSRGLLSGRSLRRRKTPKDPFTADFDDACEGGADAESMMETKSMFTTLPRNENKCSVM